MVTEGTNYRERGTETKRLVEYGTLVGGTRLDEAAGAATSQPQAEEFCLSWLDYVLNRQAVARRQSPDEQCLSTSTT